MCATDAAGEPETARVSGTAREFETEGGDPACWAGLVCPDCGSVVSEGHRDGCPSAEAPGGRADAVESQLSVP
jgi:hypothetical protein